MAKTRPADPTTTLAEARKALLLALLSPAPLPLAGGGGRPGFFTGSSPALKGAAELCVGSGWVEPAGEAPATGRPGKPLYRVTEAGARAAIAGLTQPAVDALRSRLEEIEQLALHLQAALLPLRAALAAPGSHPAAPAPADPDQPLTRERLRAAIREKYDQLRTAAGGPVTLPPLFDRLREVISDLGIERFHDELLALRREQQIDLHALDDAQRAERPEVGIYQKNTLYYSLDWKAES